MKSIVFLITLFFSFSTYAQTQFETGNKLKADCDKSDGSFSASYCFGYIIGAADANASSICTPSRVTKGQVFDIVKKYLNDNPAQLHKDADVLVLNALQQAFPCPKQK